MKFLLTAVICLFFLVPLKAQISPLFLEPTKEQADSLLIVLKQERNDTLRMAAYRELGLFYLDINSDTALYFIQQGLPLAKKLNLTLWEADALDLYAIILRNMGNYVESIKLFNQALALTEDKKAEQNIWRISKFTNGSAPRLARLSMHTTILSDMVRTYNQTRNYEEELSLVLKCIQLASSIDDFTILSLNYNALGQIYVRNNQIDSALAFFDKSILYSEKAGYRKYQSQNFQSIGNIYLEKNDYRNAKKNYLKALASSQENNNQAAMGDNYVTLANYFNAVKKYDSAIYFARLGLSKIKEAVRSDNIIVAYATLAFAYKELGDTDSVWTYLQHATLVKDSLFSIEKIRQIQNIGFNEQLRLQELEKEKIQTESKIRTFTLLFSLGVFSIIGLLLYRNNRHKQRANRVLESTLLNLRTTQSQLIQSEKMASLGELTAGIAHEIQNPLNFVNNFSEVNKELLLELDEEIKKGNLGEVNTIAKNIIDNEEKIMFHGKRADSIVKGMLQHSRSSSGVKEPTDINALADEYLRLAYHGLRAKDKSFNATMKTEFDENLGKINVVPQEIGRVILNLFTNAFYAVTERKKQDQRSYEPTVTVTTKKSDDKVLISVKDNGNGIPQKVLDKIFQPFFTTKPAGQGTGLGLSMSYEIVTKSHKGELKVETAEGEGSTFIIILPI